MEMINEALGWYLAPWRKIGRQTFNTAVGIATLAPMLVWLLGLGHDGSAGPGLGDMMSGISTGMSGGVVDPAVAQKMTALGQAAVAGSSAAAPFDWSTLMNDVIMGMMFPLVRMRLRDMGHWGGLVHWMTLGFIFIPVGMEMLGLFGVDLGLGFLGMAVQFIALGWLMIASSEDGR